MADKRILYVNPIEYGENPAVDAIAHGTDWRLAQGGVEMRVVTRNFLADDFAQRISDTIDEGIEAGVDGFILYVLDYRPLEEPARRARAAGIPVFTFARAPFEVDCALTYPNFNHGMYMTEYFATILPKNAGIGVIMGPDVPDDSEMMAGVEFQARKEGLRILNDIWGDKYANRTDAEWGGYDAAKRLLADVPKMDGIFPYNDETMLGTLRALDEVGRFGEMRIISRNGTPKAVELVREGRTDGTWDLDAPLMGFPLADAIVRKLVKGEEIGVNEVALSPVGRMVTRENVDRWVPWQERVPYEPFREGL